VHVVALVESLDHVCCRYRIAAFRPALAAAGHRLEIQPLPHGAFARVGIGRGLQHADAVIVQRKLLPRWTIALLRQRVKRLIFDFDDAVWLRDSYASRGFDDPRRANRFRALVRASDLIVAGNDYLAAEASRYTSANRVHVIPTCVEPVHYPLATHAQDDACQLVWIGSASTLRGLDRFRNTLSAVGRAIPGIRLKLICDRFLQIPDLPIDECHWREESEGREIAAASIGITFTPDDPWSQGKCGLKVLQYQAAGLPVVANPVGVHPLMVRDGETGFLAASAEDWVRAVSRLAADPGLRQRLGANGRWQVEASYSVAAGAAAWVRALEQLSGLAQLRKSG
jgi:glycosyltransferase involved in cell wall biosynthesis